MESRISILSGNRQRLLLAVALLVLLAILSTVYYLFLRTDYAILFSDLRPAEASAIVAELDRTHAPYELRDNGATVMVPADQASSIRVALAGSDLSVRGMVGFELFNESDMGLTDFAQRVNYQRALQGELARTIMMMDGIENARVHLALPERSLFRGNRSEPRAAVTIIPRRGAVLDERRVAGIQRLVSAAVPALSLTDVVVLDESGRTISSAVGPEAMMSPETEEHSAVEQYYRGRARAAVESALPGLRFQLRVIALPRLSSGAGDIPADIASEAPTEDASTPSARNFRLRIVFFTASELSVADQALVRNAVAGAVGVEERNGDSITIGVAPIETMTSQPDLPVPVVAPPAAARPEAGSDRGTWLQSWWSGLAAAITFTLFIAIFQARRPSLSNEERDRFVQRIRDHLGVGNEAEDART